MKKRLFALAAAAAAAVVLVPVARSREWRTLGPDTRRRIGGDFIRLSEGYVHYELAGPADGPVVVLVHGFSVPMYIWNGTFETLAASGFRVLRFDLYGRGYSDRPAGKYGRERFVRQLHELVTELRLEQPLSIVGLSMGGAITAAYAADHPESIRRIVLIDPMTHPVDVRPLDIPLIGDYVHYAWYVPSLPSRQGEDLLHPERFPSTAAQYEAQMHYRGFARAVLSTLRNFITRDPMVDFESLRRFGDRVLVVWAKDDQMFPFEDGEHLRRILTNAGFFAVDDAGHTPHAERPEIVNPKIAEFLAHRS